MGAVPKPHAPTVMRPTSDHTRTGLNMATVLGILGHSLDAYKQLEHLLSAGAWMTVADVDDAHASHSGGALRVLEAGYGAKRRTATSVREPPPIPFRTVTAVFRRRAVPLPK